MLSVLVALEGRQWEAADFMCRIPTLCADGPLCAKPLRANARCEMCGVPAGEAPLHVGRLLSVHDAQHYGLSPPLINSDLNLAAMCQECNMSLMRRSVTALFFTSLLIKRQGDG